MRRFRGDYPGWEPTVGLDEIFSELATVDFVPSRR
jgi:hypothetical protein